MATFPQVRHRSVLRVRLKNLNTETYIYMRRNSDGSVAFGTKGLTKLSDKEVIFKMHFYDVANEESKSALLVNDATNSSLMTEDMRLAVFQDKEGTSPADLHIADARFFYIKQTDEGPGVIALEGLSGEESKLYLTAVGSSLTLKKHEGVPYFPKDMSFYVDDFVYQEVRTHM